MIQGARGRIIEMMLSGVALIGLGLGVFVSNVSAYTDVYGVKPTSTVNSGWATTVWEIFTATCDTIDSVTFFVGAEQTGQTYTAQIYDSASQAVVWTGTKASNGWKYQDMGFGVHQPVTRGRKYYVQLGLPGTWNYFYDSSNPYPWGVMGTAVFGPQGGNDLAAWVGGVNSPPDSAYWSVNGWVSQFRGQGLDSAVTKTKSMGINISREQVQWRFFQPGAGQDDTQYWAKVDTAIYRAHQKGVRVMFDIYGAPAWAANNPDSAIDSLVWDILAWHYAPKNLDKPLGDTSANGNYLWEFLYTLAKHYSKEDSFAVHDYEIWNEMNFYDWFRYGLGKDTLGYPGYPHNQFGRAKLYVHACYVAWDAIKTADPQAKIYTNAVLHMNLPPNSTENDSNINGKTWMRYYYQYGGKNYADVITWHFYQGWSPTQKFLPGRFIADYDTLRQIMRESGDVAKPVWADEGGWGTPDVIGDPSTFCHIWSVTHTKQADIAVQMNVTGLGQQENGIGPELKQVSWYQLGDDAVGECWYQHAGLLNSWANSFSFKSSGYAYKQMTGKLKNKYFNKRLALPNTNVYAYEFEEPGTGKRTWAVWTAGSDPIYTLIPTRFAQYDSVNIAYSATPPDSGGWVPFSTGYIGVWADTFPKYFREVGDSARRPDVVVDSLYTSPPNLKAGDGLKFYARIKNIGNAALSGNVPDTVTFQVDGTTIVRYGASRGLGIPGSGTDTLTVGYFYPGYDWTATWGDHLIRAWADSADRYVELREDNNTKYLWKHFPPKVSVVINNDHKFTNHLTNDTLHLVLNGAVSPLPDSAKLKHQGTWTKIGVYGSRDTAVSYSGNGIKYDSVRVWQSGDTASAGDTIIVDITAPRAQITSPAHGATVSGTINISGYAYDYAPTHFLVDTLRYFRNSTQHDTIHVSWVNIYGGVLGTWNTVPVPNGWTRDTLVVRDSAGNVSRDSISLNVYNKLQLRGGEGFATDFGTYPSSPMNVATDPGGNVYIAETQGSKIRKHSPRKDSLFAFSAKRGDSTGLNWAVGMTLKDSTILYVADGYAHAIKAFDRQGNLLLRFGSFGTDTSRFKQPCGIALDNKERLWVSDRLNNRIQVFDSTGHFLLQFGSQGRDSTQFDSPTGIAITRKDTLLGIVQDLVWISDTRNNRVQVYQIDTVSLAVRFLKSISQVDSLGLDTPLGICSDKWGDIYVADSRHNRIVELNPFGERILDFGGLGDSLCQFRTPVGLASSPGAHYLYVADMGNRRVQRFTVILEDSSGGGPQSGEIALRTPLVYSLAQSHPNPTTGEAMIEYGLPEESQVNLNIYNVAGQIVREYNPGKQKAWYYSITWDGRSNSGHRVGAGVYFYRLQAGNWAKTRKMVIIK